MDKAPISGMVRPDPAFLITDQPQVHEVYRRWRQILNEYHPQRVLVGEIFETQPQARYILPDQLNMAFALIRAPWDAHAWRQSIDIDMAASHGPPVEPSWPLTNHNAARPIP